MPSPSGSRLQAVGVLLLVIGSILLPIAAIGLFLAYQMPEVTTLLDGGTFSPDDNMFKKYDRTIQTPDRTALPQLQIEHVPIASTLYRGSFVAADGRLDASVTPAIFASRTSLSDDIYGYLGSDPAYENTEIDNYYTIPMSLEGEDTTYQLDFAHWLGPQVDSYLAMDNIISYDGSEAPEAVNPNDISRTIIAANDLYLLPSGAHYNFTVNNNLFSLVTETGGVTLYNQSIYQLYTAFQYYHQYRTNNLDNLPLTEYMASYWAMEPLGLQWLITAIADAMILPENQDFYAKISNINDYDSFLSFINVDLDIGYRVFTRFNPAFVGSIDGCVSINIQPTGSAQLNSYSVDLWNYYSQSWVPIYTRQNMNNLLENTWLLDEFFMDSTPWQYITPPTTPSADQIQWRISVNGTNINADNPINVQFGGIWTRCHYAIVTFDLDLTFQVPNPSVTKANLYAEPQFVLEYTTTGIETSNENMILVVPLDDQIGDPQTYYVSILPQSQFYPSPLKDTRRGYPISDHLIAENTSIHLRLRGVFARYNRDGNIQTPVIAVDKLAMMYRYITPIPIHTQAFYDEDVPDAIDWIYELNVTTDITALTITHPQDLRFLTPELARVQGPGDKDITEYWLKNAQLYTSTSVNISTQILYYEGAGTYRLWFRAPNYIDDAYNRPRNGMQVLNATYDAMTDGDTLAINMETSYRIYLKEMYGVNPLNRTSCLGNYTVAIRGTDTITDTAKVLGVTGYQANYTVDVIISPELTIEYMYHSMFELNYTHLPSDQLYGNLTIDGIWVNYAGDKVGIASRQFIMPVYMNTQPVAYFHTPLPVIDFRLRTRWGVNINNSIIVTAWHAQTTAVKVNVTSGGHIYALNFSLYRYIDVKAEYDKAQQGLPNTYYTMYPDVAYGNGLPDLDYVIPSALPFYWFRPFVGGELDEVPIDYRTGSAAVILTMVSVASYPGFYSESVAKSVIVTLIDRPAFRVEGIPPVDLNEYPVINYYCPQGIIKLEFFVNDTLNEYEAGRMEVPSLYLDEGYHSYEFPYPFPFAGNYSLRLRVTDDVGNVVDFRTNWFIIQDPDQRSWILRVGDELIQLAGAWIAFAFGGYAVRRSRKISSLDIFPENISLQQMKKRKTPIIRIRERL